MRTVGLFLVAGCLAGCGVGELRGADWPQWRGPDRTGVAPGDVAPEWPAEGPRRLWKVTTPGAGYAAPAIVGNRVFITGAHSEEGEHQGWAYALSTSDGSVVWSRKYGPEWRKNYEQARSTPTVAGDRLFLVSGMGKVVCLAVSDGRVLWEVDTFERFRGDNITWGIAESPLVFDGKVVCHPGGPDAAVAALDAKTGATVWATKGLGDASAYCSPMLATLGGVRQVVTQTADHIVGVEAATGRVLWKTPHHNRYGVHPNTAVVLKGDRIVVASGYGFGAEMYQIRNQGGFSAQRMWHLQEVDNHFHGLVLHGGGVFGAASGGGLCRIDPDSGTITYRVDEAKRATLVGVPGFLVAYAEQGGSVFLLKADADRYEVKGKFKVDFGEGPHWAHPSVANGVLYIRHGKDLAAYAIGR